MHYKKASFNLPAAAVFFCLTVCTVLFFCFADIPQLLSCATKYSTVAVLPNEEAFSAIHAESESSVPSVCSDEDRLPDTSGEISAVTAAASAAVIPDGYLPVIEETRIDSGRISEENGVKIINKTSGSPEINISELIGQFKPSGGSVLIIHTHASEAYSDSFTGFYDPDRSIYSSDKEKTVIAAGKALAETLRASGINVIHDTSVFDDPSNSGAYMRAASRIKKNLREHPDIEYMIDIHRGTIQQTGGARIKPTVTVGGNSAAQFSLTACCDESGKAGLPDWKSRLSFALNLQKAAADRSPLLARPVSLEERKYNFDLCKNSVRIEIGTDANTVSEAVLTACVIGECLSDMLS